MSSSDAHLGESVGADTAPSWEQRSQTDDLIDALEELPQLTEREFRKRHEPRQHGGVFADEWSGDVARMKYQPKRAGLPGFGETLPDCGVEIPHICDDCGHRIDIGRTCAKSRCPRCAPAWITRRAPSIVARILSAAKMKSGSQKFHHVAVDAPEGLIDEDAPEEEIIDRLQSFARRIGFNGAIFYHPWRGSEEEPGDDRGKWKDRLFSGREWEGDVREELRFSPHFHMVGACEWFPGGEQTKRIWEETGPEDGKGWLFNRITPRGSSKSVRSVEHLARAVAYCMSHVGIDTDGERNTYIHGKVGSEYHNASGPHHERNERLADSKVRKVASEVLGLSSGKVECRAAVDAEDAGGLEEHSATDDSADSDDSEDDDDGDDSSDTAPCRGGITEVGDADYIEDEDWQRRARYAEHAVEAREEWEEAGGWQGWQARNSDQAVLPTGPPG